MIRALLVTLRRWALAICWCGTRHRKGYWHDPTYGQIDRDIQEKVAREFAGASRAQRHAIGLTLQNRRNGSS